MNLNLLLVAIIVSLLAGPAEAFRILQINPSSRPWSCSSASLLHGPPRGGSRGNIITTTTQTCNQYRQDADDEYLSKVRGGVVRGREIEGGLFHQENASAAATLMDPVPSRRSSLTSSSAATSSSLLAQPFDKPSSALANSSSLSFERRLSRLEDRIRSIDKSIIRLENLLTTKRARKKTVVVNYDVGPDAIIDSTDIATGAAVAFGLLGICVGRSLANNLWLVGGLVSAWIASYLAREEAPGGPIKDVVQAVGMKVATTYRQYMFMYTTGRLSYVYFKKWEQVDKKYGIMMKVERLKLAMMSEKTRFEMMEKKYELRYRVGNFFKSTYKGSIDLVASITNSKDRKELVKKLPKPFRYLFMSKAQRRIEQRRRYRVTRFCGFVAGKPVVEVDDED